MCPWVVLDADDPQSGSQFRQRSISLSRRSTPFVIERLEATEYGQSALAGGHVQNTLHLFLVGFWLSTLAFDSLSKVGKKTDFLAALVRYAILGLVLAMGLRAMGIADDIVNLTFGLILGAIAVAFALALAFGIGGRSAAGRQLEQWFRPRRRGRTEEDAQKAPHQRWKRNGRWSA